MCDTEFGSFLESQFCTNVIAEYSALGGTLAQGENPIKKIQLIVSGNAGNLYITDLDEDEDEVEGNVSHLPINRLSDNNRQGGEVSALFAQMRAIQR